MKRTMFAVTLGAALLAAPLTAQMTPPPPPPGATTQAPAYVMAAGASDLFEITSSRIALQKGRSGEVKHLARMLITDHTKTTRQVMAAAKSAKLNPPAPMLMPEQQAMIDALNAAPAGASFDSLYLSQQLPAHQAALVLQQGYASTGDTASLRKVASSAVPVIQMHIQHVQQLQSKTM